PNPGPREEGGRGSWLERGRNTHQEGYPTTDRVHDTRDVVNYSCEIGVPMTRPASFWPRNSILSWSMRWIWAGVKPDIGACPRIFPSTWPILPRLRPVSPS